MPDYPPEKLDVIIALEANARFPETSGNKSRGDKSLGTGISIFSYFLLTAFIPLDYSLIHPAPDRGVCSLQTGRGAVAGSGASEMRREFPLTGGPSRFVPARRPRVNRPRDGVVLHPVTERSGDLGQQRWISGMPIQKKGRVA
jgi:hypothetical protein